MSLHTPWRACATADDGWVVLAGNDPEDTEIVAENLTPSDAALIAAAPALLVTLEVTALALHMRHPGPMAACPDGLCQLSHAVLAKARAESDT